MKGMINIYKISVVIVTWNNSDVIGNCLDSFMKYTDKDSIELIIVDNNSQDSTCKIVESYQKKLCIKLIQSPDNLGFAKANNLGVLQASYENILLLNPDTVLMEFGLEELPKKLENEKVGILGSKLLNADYTLQPSMYKFDNVINILIEQFQIGRVLPESFKKKYSPYLSKHDIFQNTDWVIGAFMLLQKSDFTSINGFSEDYFMYSEDMDLCYKMKEKGKKIVYDPTYSIIHIGGTAEVQDFNSSKQEKMFLSRNTFAKKYDYRLNIPTFLLCYRIKFFISYMIGNRNKIDYYKNTIENLKKIRGVRK